MKKLIFSLVLTLLANLALAYPLLIQSWNIEQDVKTINTLNLSIDRVNRLTGSIIVDVRNQEGEDLLLQHGFAVTRIPDQAREYYEYLIATTRGSDNPLDAYYSLTEFQTFLQDMQDIYPNLCQLVQYGSSIQNRPLYALKISDNVSVNEAEPEVKLIANIHGDEPIGYDMLIRTIELLLTDYGTSPRITDIVNNTELWFIPMMNPDGYANGVRYNAAGVDLNRNFPMPTGITNPDGNPLATENLAMIDFSHQHNFVCGINFHSGALVVNYPWDYTPVLTPDDALLIDMSLTYAQHNLPMYNSNEFAQGITNGAAWYVITGSMQDWNYAFTSNIEYTMELSNTKWPNASTLNNYWANNQESILSFIEYAQNGLKGTVTNASGNPIPATITVSGNAKTILNDPSVGDYHRLLLPGTYLVTASADSHIPQTVEITVPAQGHTIQNFALESASQLLLGGIVRDIDGYPVDNAQITLYTDPTVQTTTDINGQFILPSTYEGDYQFQVSSAEHGIFQSSLQLRQENGTGMVIVLGEKIFADDFENGLGAWNATSPWGIVQEGGNSVLTDSPAGNYGNSINKSIRTADAIDLSNILKPLLSFRARWNLETGYDYVYVEASANGSNWTELTSFTGQQNVYTQQVLSLDAFSGSNLYLRFRIRADQYQNADGIYIDDVAVSGWNSSHPVYGDANGDKVINARDIRAVLNHAVGRSLPAVMLIAADTDQDSGVNTMDASHIQSYILNPDFRFPVQTLVPFALPEVAFPIGLKDGNLHLNLESAQLLKSLYLDIPFVIDGVYATFDEELLYLATGDDGEIAMVARLFPSSLTIGLIDNSAEFVIPAQINGHSRDLPVSSTSSEDQSIPALSLSLGQNYPNPFNPTTQISFYLPENQTVALKIYNLKGQVIKTLIETKLAAGEHSFVWNGLDSEGEQVSTGIYLYRLYTPQQNITRKMVLSK
ncbi:MAG: carboxypeptidase regulatory-like domain-containing protein [Candidatus Cloacimonetes bacterium]|nr:carboxypeptidase regulatory-like domain-containing protein [Candidatus Cloacimonadota bacterium]MDY0172822.1 M14 family zinc carboxypeptidase [Candidatus Cloacimonadaceae bacterium]